MRLRFSNPTKSCAARLLQDIKSIQAMSGEMPTECTRCEKCERVFYGIGFARHSAICTGVKLSKYVSCPGCNKVINRKGMWSHKRICKKLALTA